jgi:hypothetical protein
VALDVIPINLRRWRSIGLTAINAPGLTAPMIIPFALWWAF